MYNETEAEVRTILQRFVRKHVRMRTRFKCLETGQTEGHTIGGNKPCNSAVRGANTQPLASGHSCKQHLQTQILPRREHSPSPLKPNG
jgi:hypothetical protein